MDIRSAQGHPDFGNLLGNVQNCIEDTLDADEKPVRSLELAPWLFGGTLTGARVAAGLNVT